MKKIDITAVIPVKGNSVRVKKINILTVLMQICIVKIAIIHLMKYLRF